MNAYADKIVAVLSRVESATSDQIIVYVATDDASGVIHAIADLQSAGAIVNDTPRPGHSLTWRLASPTKPIAPVVKDEELRL